MFSKSSTSIFSWLFFVSIGSQIIDAEETKAFPDLRPTDNPLINLDDPRPGIREPDFSRNDEPILRLCVPKGAEVNQNQLENEELNNSSDPTNSSSQENLDNCTPIYQESN
ncbi:MAG: hypothetical protein QNJ60_07520 [Xenococcaceae cyanobacterium MO_188.B19]|nr:hypothetical protein [Xenococcaceae cyanobacterium MO_188.B19]